MVLGYGGQVIWYLVMGAELCPAWDYQDVLKTLEGTGKVQWL